MRLVFVTGMSGAGKTTVLNCLEDAGYYCVDGIPILMIEDLVKQVLMTDKENSQKIAIGIDSRNGNLEEVLTAVIQDLNDIGIRPEVLFLDAEDKVLIKRYKETRRKHPFALDGRINEGIEKERAILEPTKKHADYVINTNKLLGRELKKEIERIFVDDQEYAGLYITVLSFGFKNGIPLDADVMFDVRFLPNPYYIDELRPLSGNDREIVDYLNQFEETRIFEEKLSDMLEFLIPQYIKEEKHQLIIAVGCTGGRHRSVMIANSIYRKLSEKRKYGIRVEHRDLEKDKEHKRVD